MPDTTSPESLFCASKTLYIALAYTLTIKLMYESMGSQAFPA
jgi:hypothetical protein